MASQSPNGPYTILIFRGATSGPTRFRLGVTTVRRLLWAGAVLLVIQIGFGTHYLIQRGQVEELQATNAEGAKALERLRSKLAQAEDQTRKFAETVARLKDRVLTVKKTNEKVRVMLGLPPQLVEQQREVNGRGGDEVPFLEGGSRDEDAASGDRAQGFPVKEEAGQNPVLELTPVLERELSWLDQETSIQERQGEELVASAEQRRARWEATPSIWPVKGWITSSFGRRVSPFTGKPAMHRGLDIGAEPGSPIQAPAGGVVRIAGYDSKMGRFITIDHGYGIETQYGHLQKILVTRGQRVQRGENIGLVGSSGRFSTGPHLHYQVAVNDRVVNPRRFILE